MSKKISEMGAAGISGFQLPLGVKDRKDEIEECLREAADVNGAHVLVATKLMDEQTLVEFYDALDFQQYSIAAGMIREEIVREAVRRKLNEVVRKRAGGGGYTLYAPNKGKKHRATPVSTFPTKLAAKRAELARFPPKDPKKLQRLRKEIEKLLRDPKKRAEAEKRAMLQKGTDVPKHHRAGHHRGRHVENKIIAKAIVNTVRHHLAEGLFREKAQPSAWDEFVKKVSDKTLDGDRGFKKVMGRMDSELKMVMSKALKEIQKNIGAAARVKPMGVKKHEDGRTYTAFKLVTDGGGDVGPMYVYSEDGVPAIELSDEAKAAFSRVDPMTAKSIRAALSAAQENLEKLGSLRALTQERDAYLSNLENESFKELSKMSPVKRNLIKRLLVKKFRGQE